MDVVWEAPGPGRWAVDRSHMPSGTTAIVQSIMSEAMPAGMRRVFAELGAPIDTIDVRFVHGQFYSRLRPLVAPDRAATKAPPVPVLKVLTRLHPEFRRRNRRAAEVIATQPWMTVIDEWNGGGRARIEAANRELQAVPLATLDDDAVVRHATRVLAHCRANVEHHFWLHGYDVGPIGQLLFVAADWGIPADELLSLLEGASPSTSAPAVELARIRAAVDASGRSPVTLDELRAISPQIGRMVDEYLDRRGAVLFSRYDVDGVTLGERPDLVLAAIMNAEVRDVGSTVAARIAATRERVPEAHRAEFDQLLGQARAAMDLRDDNGPMTAEWPLGLLRLALLELGRRGVARGLLDRPELALELAPHELATVLHGEPSGEALTGRAAARQAQKRLSAPDTLGPEEPPPPAGVLPPGLARLTGMVQTVMQQMGMAGEAGADPLSGTGIGTQPVTATARVASTPEEALDVLEPGDILVVAGTTPAYNLVLTLAGGLVTADGGPMCHAAVIARELGIPAIVGARGALLDIPDGATVRLDPSAGSVTVLAPG